jgi:hypothetical protein
VERRIWKYLVQKKFKLEPIPKEKGFYLTAPGRRAYHQLVTTCVWNALLYLQLLKKHEARVNKNHQDKSDIYKLTDEANLALHSLEMLAYRNPIIGIHLDWLDKKNPNNKRKPNEDENPTNGDITGEEADIVPSLKGIVLKKPSSTFLVSGGRGAAVLRWLRLITLHHFAIWTLLSTDTVLKLPQLSINLVKTGLPIELNQMQSLQSYLSKMKKPKNSDDITLVINALGRSEREVDIFRGTYHCEAILLSLYLLHYETRANAAVDFDLFCQSVGVDPLLADAAGNFFTRVVAVSKRCCPVCNQLFRVMYQVLRKQYSIMGSHTAYSPCALPPFLPKKYADMWRMHLKNLLEPRLDDYIMLQRNNQFRDRGSASPVQYLQGNSDEYYPPEYYSDSD